MPGTSLLPTVTPFPNERNATAAVAVDGIDVVDDHYHYYYYCPITTRRPSAQLKNNDSRGSDFDSEKYLELPNAVLYEVV
jgi:hypothetical protein